MTKIYYIANVRMPTEKAHGYQITKMCEVFALRCDMELVVPTRRDEIKNDLFDYYGLKKNFKVTKVFVPDFIDVSPLFLRKFGFFFQSAFFLLRLLFFKVSKDAVVYSRNPEIVWLFSRRGHKTIFESHRWVDTKTWLHVFLVSKALKIIAVTLFLKKLYCGAGFLEENVLVAPDGVDFEIFDIDISQKKAREMLGLPLDSILLGYTGRAHTMGMEKGFEIMTKSVDVLSSLIRANRRIVLVVVGGEENKISDHLIMVQNVNRKKLAFYQKAFDVLLMPFPKTTHYSYYMSPMKMFEYMASRRPIVASDLPSVREVLNESNAVLVEPGNPKALGEGIKKVLDNPEFAEKITNQAYEDAKKYTWEKRGEKILQFISLSNQVAK